LTASLRTIVPKPLPQSKGICVFTNPNVTYPIKLRQTNPTLSEYLLEDTLPPCSRRIFCEDTFAKVEVDH